MDHNAKPPTVSIGLPVHNGEDFMRVAIDSLLAQDYADFELVISDNASTDGTTAICEEYARRDRRVRFHRSDTNLGAAENFNRVFRLSRGRYFMWAAHDDRWHPSYVRRCLDGLERNGNAVLCGTSIRFIDEEGIELDSASLDPLIGDYNRLHTVGMTFVERARELTRTINWYVFYGLIRADVLRQSKLFRNAYAGDVLLLIELLFHGETLILPEPLFDYRLVRKSAETQMESISGVAAKAKGIRAYTLIAEGLLEVIDEFPVSTELKRTLREDLLENVSFANQRWADRIVTENEPDIVSDHRYVASFQIRDLLAGVPVRAPEALRESAFQKSLSGLPPADRMRQQIQRVLDRHLLWRFRPKS